MIAYLKGILANKAPSSIIVDVNGVGYDLAISLNTFYSLPDPGKEILVYTYTHLREDMLQLYGFKTMEEKRAFIDLISISGIGPRLAIAILSGIVPSELAQAVYEHNVKRLQKIPGVGKRTAERIILEMKHKMKIPETRFESEIGDLTEESPYTIALTALTHLGYSLNEAERALAVAKKLIGEKVSVEELLKASLRVMAGV
ncbi:MAG: Holliday junction branch migration protein RuvA [Syntrophobacterales bacterium]|nr:Holliday junction branch migration protein RuvA [Syntrophobacterales bacterium]